MKKQTGIAKDQYKFFKDQINVINNRREDGVKTEVGVKTEDGEINVHNKYIDNKYTILINSFFTHGLKDEDLHLTNFDNPIGSKSITNRYLEEKMLMTMIIFLISRIRLKI